MFVFTKLTSVSPGADEHGLGDPSELSRVAPEGEVLAGVGADELDVLAAVRDHYGRPGLLGVRVNYLLHSCSLFFVYLSRPMSLNTNVTVNDIQAGCKSIQFTKWGT